MKPERVCEISLKFPPPSTITTHFHSFKPITRFSLYFPFLSLPPRLIIIFFLKKLMGTSIQDLIENYVRAKRAPHDPSSPFKEKEKGGEGRSKAWWPMERKGEVSFAWRPMECSIVWWRMECEGKTLFTSSHFPSNKFI
jgi:hypothetical protein